MAGTGGRDAPDAVIDGTEIGDDPHELAFGTLGPSIQPVVNGCAATTLPLVDRASRLTGRMSLIHTGVQMMRASILFSSISALGLLVSCAGSAINNVSHATRRDFSIDGIKLAVVKQPGHYVSWFVSDNLLSATPPPLPVMKAAQIKAIEDYSKCKVVSAEFQPKSVQPALLQAIVKCD